MCMSMQKRANVYAYALGAIINTTFVNALLMKNYILYFSLFLLRFMSN